MTQSGSELEQAAKMTSLVGQIGCVTGFVSIIIVAVAFAIGRFLDSQLDTGGIFTVLFMLGSFPITLYAIIRISLATLKRAQSQQADSKDTEESLPSEEDTETS